MRGRPEPNEYPEWYDGYVKSVAEGNIVDLLNVQLEDIMKLAGNIQEDISFFRYEPDKWSIKEIFGHLNDAERILSTRALRFIRKDKTDIPQYDHNEYVAAANFDRITLKKLAEEFKYIRSATRALFAGVNGDDWMLTGTAGGKSFTVRAMAYIIFGHANHHITILNERYLNMI
jgi:hypothetical protein